LVALSACTSKQSYLARGNQLFEAGKYADASINYRKAIQKDPRFGEAYYRLGLTALKQGDANQAYMAFTQAVELLPDNDDAKEKLGDLCLSAYLQDPRRPQKLYDQVARLTEKLLARNSNSYAGLRFKGILARTDRKPEEAIALFRKALLVKPADPPLTAVLADTLYQNGHTQEGEALALDLIARANTYGPIYDQLYAWYFKANRIAEAEDVLKTKVNNNPKQADYILQLAFHYYRLHKPAEMSATLSRLLDDPKDFPDAQLRVGDFYLTIRNFPEAIRYYQEAARSHPQDNIACQKRITDALLAEGKKAEASSVVEQILKEQPKEESALRVRASLWLDSGQPENVDKALRELTALSALHPEDAALRFQMGRAHLLKGDPETARRQFQEAIARRKDFVEARFQLAAVNLTQRRASDALQQASEILSLRPNDPRARMLHAVALFSSGDRISARTELTRLIADFPQYTEPRLELGLLALSEKKYTEAREIFEKLGGKDPRAVSGLAATSSSEHQFAKAIELLNGALQKSPDSLMLREQLANTAVAAGQYDLAISEYRKLLTSASKSALLRVRLGEVYDLKGDSANAIALYREAQRLSPQDAASTFLLAVALAKTGHGDESQAQYRNLLKAHPDNWAAMNNLAFLLAENGGDLDEAMSLAQRAAQQVPGQSHFSDTVGYVYLKKGMRANAVRTFSGLVQKYPSNPTFHYHLGMALLETGEKEAARNELGAALANHPSENEAAKIRELAGKIG
jgi:tetratricopeptide (TPR) repeat protein